jgi:hypothetical protein
MRSLIWIAAATLFGAAPGEARANEPAAQAEKPCAAAEYHTLDFWIGRWRVETPAGELAGESHVEPVLSGCALLEHWRGIFLPSGRVQEGLGVHRYDAATRQWRQAWTDETPSTADSVGREEGGAIIYERQGASGARTRMSLRPLDDGRVEQKGERWDEASDSWQVTFHLLYSRH